MSGPLLILLADGMLLLAAGLFGYSGRITVSLWILAATALLALLQWILFDTLRSTGQTVRIESSIKSPHYVQGCLLFCLYLYWGLYWDEVRSHAPLIVVQLIFAYAFEMLLSWSRYRVWRAGFGPIPIVLSLNLFLWFKDEYFLLQFAMIVLVYLGKELVRWNRGGQRIHIFNPSAFPLAFISIALLATGKLGFTHGFDITISFNLPPNMLEVLFLLGLVIQFLYGTTLVTLGAVLTHYLLYSLATAAFGFAISPIPISVSVFLGLTFLATDPSTSPRTQMGKFLFGVVYGAGIFFIFWSLRFLNQPTFSDKVLMVPLINLLVPLFDRFGAAYGRFVNRATWMPTLRFERYAWLALYIGLFVFILPRLKTPPPTPDRSVFSQSASTAAPSLQMTRLIDNKQYCRYFLLPKPYLPFGFRSEISEFRKIRDVYQRGQAKYPVPAP